MKEKKWSPRLRKLNKKKEEDNIFPEIGNIKAKFEYLYKKGEVTN